MKRYFVKASYDGTDYSGWQSQPNAITVQGEIERAISLVTRKEISIVGCGRTDAGVHASEYYFHLDIVHWDENIIYKLNGILPNAIKLISFLQVEPNCHARFDATSRSYSYYLHGEKDPFRKRYSSRIVGANNFSIEKLNEVAEYIAMYKEFYPFCKSNHDAKTLECRVTRAEWIRIDTNSLRFEISANRFLRGMVRLIVGACINVQKGKLKLSSIEDALEKQTRLSQSWSAPSEGLFLSKIEYPFLK